MRPRIPRGLGRSLAPTACANEKMEMQSSTETNKSPLHFCFPSMRPHLTGLNPCSAGPVPTVLRMDTGPSPLHPPPTPDLTRRVTSRYVISITLTPTRRRMEVLSGPWADLALLLRQTDRQTDGFLPLWLFALLLFLSVCLLLLQLLVFLSWKLGQAEADLSELPQDRSALYRQVYGSTHQRMRSAG
ncbi:hypothetical protein EYF80_054151 [Liparis tanakae]|uniref:Uncharacterized protein n=1 Tax=Liparis tanakae TaxID=230148 RepID=A0A4Z2F472_9TELE|nr:hypothetical protein EYF80_054151 [Liparis tanakae]